jgi:DNA-binding response OmpR family regulator
MSTTTCPCCGAQTERPWVWSLDAGIFSTASGRTRRFSPAERQVLDTLVRANGRVVSSDTILLAMYGERDEPDEADNVLKVRICAIRRELRRLGVAIKNEPSVGYRLVLPSGPKSGGAATLLRPSGACHPPP